jgi:hypothetical protein
MGVGFIILKEHNGRFSAGGLKKKLSDPEERTCQVGPEVYGLTSSIFCERVIFLMTYSRCDALLLSAHVSE